jgi:3-methyladenine DNA glycosylase Tag
VNGLLADPGIVPNRAEIEGTINNARRYGELAETFGRLAACVWRPAASRRPWNLYPPRTWISAAVNEGRQDAGRSP